jgi:hypothetical protein
MTFPTVPTQIARQIIWMISMHDYGSDEEDEVGAVVDDASQRRIGKMRILYLHEGFGI